MAAGDGGRARHIQRAADVVLSLGTKGRGLSFSQKCRRMNRAAGDDGHVLNCGKGTVPPHHCAVCLGPCLAVQVTPNQSSCESCVTKPI